MVVDLTFEIGGPQGGGIESAGQIALRAFMLKGYRVYGTREYHSNIMGKHSYFNIRVRPDDARAPRLPADIVVALDAESVFTHYNDVGEIMVYDTGVLKTKMDRIPSMSKYLKARVQKELEENNVEPTVAGVIELLEKRGKKTVGVPLKQLLKKTSEDSGVPLVSISIAINTIGLAVGMSLIGVEVEHLEKAIALFFAGKKKVIHPNVVAARIAYDYAKENFSSFHRDTLPDGPHHATGKERLIVSGNDIVAMGKIAGGLRIQTYYPITPAADESLYLEKFEEFPLEPWAQEKLGIEGWDSGCTDRRRDLGDKHGYRGIDSGCQDGHQHERARLQPNGRGPRLCRHNRGAGRHNPLHERRPQHGNAYKEQPE